MATLQELQQKGAKPVEKGLTLEELKAKGATPIDGGFWKSVARAIIEPVATLGIARPIQLGQTLTDTIKNLLEDKRGFESIAETEEIELPLIGKVSPPEGIKGIRQDIGRAAQTIGLGLGPIAGGAAIGGGIQLEKETTTPLKVVGGILGGAALGKAGEIALAGGGQLISKGIEKVKEPIARGVGTLFERTAQIPAEVTEQAILQPKAISTAQRQIEEKGLPKFLDEIQTGIRRLRTQLTQSWNEGKQLLINQFKGQRVGLVQNELKLAQKVANDFGIELPQNLENLSINELLDLNAEVNSLYSKRLVRESAEGIPVRKLKDILDDKLKNNFKIGEKNPVREFLSEYGNEKRVHDAMDTLFNAYQTREPKRVAQAFREMLKVFNEDKFSYVNAIQDFEKATGIDLLDQLRAIHFQKIIPETGGKFDLSEVLRLVLLPLTSPRLVGLESKTLGRLLNTSQSIAGFVAKIPALTKELPKKEISNIPMGLSTKAIKTITYKKTKIDIGKLSNGKDGYIVGNSIYGNLEEAKKAVDKLLKEIE